MSADTNNQERIDKMYLDAAAAYAKKNSTCMKVCVGAAYVGNGIKVYSCNSGKNHNCKEAGKCYKAEVTGIYESCEETRKYCQSIHAEIDMISKLTDIKVENPDGTLYVTRYPCLNCLQKCAEFGFKRIVFCGVSKGTVPDDVVKEITSKYGIEYIHYPEVDYEF